MAAVVAALKAKRRRHLAKLQLDRDRAESDARRAFPDFDASGQGLDSSELQRLLQKLQPDSEIDHALVDYVYHLGCRKHGVERISPECMRDILQYTKYYLGKVQWLDDIFAKFDTDRSGTLDRSQLKRALIDARSRARSFFDRGPRIPRAGETKGPFQATLRSRSRSKTRRSGRTSRAPGAFPAPLPSPYTVGPYTVAWTAIRNGASRRYLETAPLNGTFRRSLETPLSTAIRNGASKTAPQRRPLETAPLDGASRRPFRQPFETAHFDGPSRRPLETTHRDDPFLWPFKTASRDGPWRRTLERPLSTAIRNNALRRSLETAIRDGAFRR
ncbi:hypothetical protein M885DRAFT_53530 [Pelagophyceae sp. CCMP2097]|nr:hypothetical protein M885DRAFT_53530 [Pelagophyceae sp. CCMP2097]